VSPEFQARFDGIWPANGTAAVVGTAPLHFNPLLDNYDHFDIWAMIVHYNEDFDIKLQESMLLIGLASFVSF